MRIMVFDVPAEESGALSILQDFYNEITLFEAEKIEWFFILSKPQLPERSNIKILRFPWIKKSWFHRLYFDYVIAPKLIKEYKVDKVISLQNMIIPRVHIEQTLYVHNPMPFTEYRFTLIGNPKFWIYQNIIGRMIKKSILQADKVIVQTNWMRQSFIESYGLSADRVFRIAPKIKTEVKKPFSVENLKRKITFFYPANDYIYKNHKTILQACEILGQKGTQNYQVIFTLNGNESPHIRKIYEQAQIKNLPIDFLGKLTRDQVFDLYSRTVLIFPSYIETFGLPLLEARMHQCIILASDTVFSREILAGYENSYFFDPFKPEILANLMADLIQKKIAYNDPAKEFEGIMSRLSIADIAMAKPGEAIG